MVRCALAILFYALVSNISFAFEIENYDDKDVNVTFIKRNNATSKQVKKNAIKKKTNLKNNTSKVRSAVVNENIGGKKQSTKKVSSAKKITASVTGNIDSSMAKSLLKKKSNISVARDILSNSSQSFVVDSELCSYVERNDVVSLKRKLSSMKYAYKYVNGRCKNNTSLLLLSIEKNNYLSARLLIEKGADPNIQDDAGVSPLHWIARNNEQDYNKILDLIMNISGVKLNLRDIEGYTPLMRAVEFGREDVVAKLVNNGANLDIKNNYDENAMSIIKKKIAVNKEQNKNNQDSVNDDNERILKLLENDEQR